MFESLSDKLKRTLKNLRGEGVLTKEHVDAALREIRLALLEADVNYKVAKDFIASVKEKAEGQHVWQELKPSEQVVKIVYDELVDLLGGQVQSQTHIGAWSGHRTLNEIGSLATRFAAAGYDCIKFKCDLEDDVVAFVQKAIERDANKRFQNPGEFRDALTQLSGNW